MDPETPPRVGEKPPAIQVATYLWEEYRYRHDLVWQLVFRVTAVATLLLIAPLLADQPLRKAVGRWLLFSPVIAILVIAMGYYVLQCELRVLKRIKDAYRATQNRALQHLKSDWVPHEIATGEQEQRSGWQRITLRLDYFEERVALFLILIMAAAIAFLILLATVWLPKM